MRLWSRVLSGCMYVYRAEQHAAYTPREDNILRHAAPVGQHAGKAAMYGYDARAVPSVHDGTHSGTDSH